MKINRRPRRRSVAAFLGFTLIASLLVATATPTSADPGDTLSGLVFRDEDWDGASAGELGQAGVEVTVTDTAGATAGPFTSATDGTWTTTTGALDGLTGPYLVSFEIPSALAPLQPGPLGTDNRSDVRSAAANATDVDFGVVYPYHYCQDNPNVITNCYIQGDQSGGGDVLVQTEYLADGDGLDQDGIPPDGTPEFVIADAADIGTTWGLAIQTFNDRDTTNDRVWTAAMEKRFAGYAPGLTAAQQPDAIFLVDPSDGSVEQTILSVDAGTSNHDFTEVSGQLVDAASYRTVGKQAWGDLDISDDQTKLYGVNLFDRRLYEFDIDPTSGTYLSSTGDWALTGLTGQSCSGGTVRPWGVGQNEGLLYVGSVCDDASNAWVHTINPATDATALALTIPLGYTREPIGNHTGLLADWQAWTDSWAGTATGWGFPEVGHPQPILSDIEFDQGSLILGLRDRYGDQTGYRNASITWPIDPSLYSTDAAGDVLWACRTGVGTFALEGSAGCLVTNDGGANSGPGGVEWFDGDEYLSGGVEGHDEIGLGGLASNRTRGDHIGTGYDTLDDVGGEYAFSNGLYRLDNTSGDKVGQYRVVEAGFGKAAGLGDVEAFCVAAPVEIGNFVWLDADGDGVQDADEEALSGVVVTLTGTDASGNVNPQATTGADGYYSFSVEPDTAYTLTFDVSGASAPITTINPATLVATAVDQGGNDEFDNDAVTQSSGAHTITLTSGDPGENDHSFDAGFVEANHRIGNQVWLDVNDNGVADDGELAIAGIGIELYLESGDSVGFDVNDTRVGTTTTDAEGNYWFDGLLADTYYVGIPSDQSANTVQVNPGTGATTIDPTELRSSTGIDTADDDNDNTDDGDPAAGFLSLTGAIALTNDGEPTAEADSNESPDRDAETYVEGEGSPDLQDADSNLTVDLGLVPVPRVGGLLWIDGDVGDAGYRNGEADAAESTGTVAGATVRLYRDVGVAGVFEDGVDVLVDTTTTDAGGNYYFTDVTEGDDYFVAVPSGQTGQTIGGSAGDLSDYASSPGQSDADTGADDVDDGAPTTGFASVSTVFTVGLFDNPTNELADFEGATAGGAEADANTTIGSYLPDASSDLTIDFGYFETPTYEIGNLVWNDQDNDGLAETGEAGIGGVRVELWEDTRADDAPDTFVAATNTAADGTYNFPGLAAGDYVVVIPDDQSAATTPTALDPFLPGTSTGEADPDSDGDNNENGVNDLDLSGSGGPVGRASGVLTVGEGSDLADEPTDEQVRSDDATADDSPTGERDDRSNLTVDFGYYRLSLGNQVWFDDNNDGSIDTGEDPVVGVVVQLWEDTDSSGTVDTLVDSTTTDGSGLYLFTGMDEGDYAVVIPASEFGTGEPLEGAVSSTPTEADPDDDGDNNDNGAPASGTVATGIVELRVDDEPTSENPDNDTDTPDRNENLTVDLGFYRLRLGNQVWSDTGAGANEDNAVFDTDESGIPNVIVQLWQDTDTSGDFDPAVDTLLDTTTTDGEGNYWFDGLRAATPYIVAIPDAGNAGSGEALETTSSSTLTSANPNTADNDDDGAPQTGYKAVAAPVTLTPAGEATAEADTGDAGGAEAEANAAGVTVPDANSNLLVDFGFVTPATFEIGNLVWFDDDNDGVVDTGETGVPGVSVQLWRDTDADGEVDLLVATTDTDGSGHYNFPGLVPGDYAVVIPDDQTGATAPTALDGFLSSTGGETEPDDDTDDNDNGVDQVDASATSGPVGLASGLLTVGEGTDLADEPTDEVDESPTGLRDDRSNLSVDFGFYQLSLGNQLWADVNNDGIADPGEAGLPGVTVNLWADDDLNGTPDRLVATTTTDGSGHYLFTGLVEGDYLVEIPASQFTEGAPLHNLIPSDPFVIDPETGGDLDSNGVEQTDGAVRTGTITLDAGTEPTGENPDNDPDTVDDNENLTLDLGFYGLTLGNRVWFDTDADGLLGTGESGVPGVTVDLWRDIDSNGTPDELVAVTTTDATGHYLFEGLSEGDYIVQIGESNFGPSGPLNGWVSSSGAGEEADPDTDGDNNDNGIDPTETGGPVLSAPVTLTALGEPTDETDVPTGHDDPSDDSANVSLDFGFHQLSLGNRIWLDVNDNGVIDSGEAGVGGVTVVLYADADNDGVADDDDNDGNPDPIGTTVTDDDGYYRFYGLVPGDYIVGVPSSNFDDGGPLDGTFSSSNTTDDPDDDTDADDNGIDPDAYGGVVFSRPITLAANTEPTAETDSGAGQANSDDDSNLTVDFGFYPTPSISGTVFDDEDRDGRRDEGEGGLSGVTVVLVNDEGETVSTTTTDNNGDYVFDNLTPDDYRVSFPSTGLPDNYDLSTDDCGCPDDVDSEADPSTGLSPLIPLGPGDNVIDVDAGASERPGTLAFTGSSTLLMALSALAMLAAGGLLTVGVRRRRSAVEAA